MLDTDSRLQTAGESTRRNFGQTITFYLPGMFTLGGITGKYPAISITGDLCELTCDHCQGKILSSMIPAITPEKLIETCKRLWNRGHLGVLISGGCDQRGALPWEAFADAIQTVKTTTDLIISVHSGLVNRDNALRLKHAGVDQALIDVIGDDDTFRKMYHLPGDVSQIADSMAALNKADLPVVPHIVCGLNYGQIVGEYQAINMLSQFDIAQLVIVSLMGIRGTKTWKVPSPKAEAVADVIAEARLRMPRTRLSLGCARQRGDRRLETLAIDAGINRMALPSDTAIGHARSRGLTIFYQKTCCSVTQELSADSWR